MAKRAELSYQDTEKWGRLLVVVGQLDREEIEGMHSHGGVCSFHSYDYDGKGIQGEITFFTNSKIHHDVRKRVIGKLEQFGYDVEIKDK